MSSGSGPVVVAVLQSLVQIQIEAAIRAWQMGDLRSQAAGNLSSALVERDTSSVTDEGRCREISARMAASNN